MLHGDSHFYYKIYSFCCVWNFLLPIISDSVEIQAHEAMIELSNHHQKVQAVMNQTQPEIWVKDLRTKGKMYLKLHALWRL